MYHGQAIQGVRVKTNEVFIDMDFITREAVLFRHDDLVICSHCTRFAEQCEQVGSPMSCGFMNVSDAEKAGDIGFNNAAKWNGGHDDISE